nr:purine permease [Tanacetum cinerariifolium]
MVVVPEVIVVVLVIPGKLKGYLEMVVVVEVAAAPSRRRKGVVIRDPEEESTTSTIIPAETKSKDKDNGILAEEDPAVKRYQVLKRKPQTEAQAKKNMIVYLKNVAGFKMDYFKGMSYDNIRPIFKAKFNLNVAFLLKTKEQIKEDENRALKRLNETPAERAAKGQNLDEEVVELKRHLQIVPNEDDDVYTKASPLARKVPVVDYQIIEMNKKPYYKIIRADDTHQLYVSFLSLLRNFDRENLEALWSLVKERFSTTKPKNFSDDFLLVTLGVMFEKLDIHAQIWKNQRSVHGPAKLILLVERKYPLTRFTLDQMLNAVRLEVEEESEVSLELLRLRPDAFEAKADWWVCSREFFDGRIREELQKKNDAHEKMLMEVYKFYQGQSKPKPVEVREHYGLSDFDFSILQNTKFPLLCNLSRQDKSIINRPLRMMKVTDLEANLEQFKIDQAAINSNAAKQWALLQETIEKNKPEADRQFAEIMNALKARQSPTTLPVTIPCFKENSGQSFSGKEVKGNCFKGAHVTEVVVECGGKKLPLTDRTLKDLDTEDSCTCVGVLESANSQDSTNPTWAGDQSRIREKDVPSHGP